jgi:hypothetical protein
MENMDELSNKDLQAKLVELGMPEEEASKIATKSTLIATINTLQSMKAQVEEATETAVKATEQAAKATEASEKASIQEVENPLEERKVEKSWKTKAHKQWDHWDKSPKVRILVPLVGQEKQGVIRWEHSRLYNREVPVHVSGAIQTAIENGAQYVIPKGIYVEVPEPVAKLIEAKFQQTSDAGRESLADRIDSRTGRPVSDQL